MRFEANAPIAQRGIEWRLLLAASLAMLTLMAATTGQLRGLSALGLVVIISYSIFSALRGDMKPGKEVRAIAADSTGLTIDGSLVMPHARIARGYAAPAETGYVVHLEGGRLRRACSVFVDTEAEAQAMLTALQLESSTRTAQFRALPPWARHVRWLSVVLTASPWVLINVLRLLPIWGWGILVALYAVILLPTLLPQRVEVGQDGIFLRWLGNKRFVPFGTIETMTSTPFGLALDVRGGRTMEIRLTQKEGGANANRDALFSRIKTGMDAHRGLTRADEESLLARGSRDVDTWLRDMRTLGAAEGSYRSVALPREKLWEVLENPSSDPSAREGAALALHASLDDDERARLRALTATTASPRLRVALDGVTREREETRLRIALAAADVEEPISESLPAARAAPPRASGAE